MDENDDKGEIGPPPSQTKSDVVQAIARGAASAVPVIGGPVAELLGLVLQPALERRREEWFRELAGALDELRQRLDDFDPRELADNEVFITAVISASNAALRTHEEEKLTALRNAVVSSALAVDLDEHVQLMFIRFVDELTSLHLRLLTYLRDPTGWFERFQIDKPNIMMGGRTSILEAAMPDLADDPSIYMHAAGELATRGLIENSLSGMVSEQGLYTPLATPLGSRFLDYITNDESPS
jgi:hypothetical protein